MAEFPETAGARASGAPHETASGRRIVRWTDMVHSLRGGPACGQSSRRENTQTPSTKVAAVLPFAGYPLNGVLRDLE